ncbi:MAG: hypothetical protein AAF587_32875 [Bacteroidota bacterium]
MNKLFFFCLFFLFACKPVVKNIVQADACTNPAVNELIDSCAVSIPNIFTPNGDGINDVFLPVIACELDVFSMKVQDGDKVLFSSDDIGQASWNGTFEEEVYLGFLSYTIGGVFKDSGTAFSFEGFVASVPYDITGQTNRDVYELENCEACVFADQLTGVGVLNPTNEPQDFLCED